MSIGFSALNNLPPPDVVRGFSYASILQAMRDDAVSRYPDFAGFIDLETEPARIILEVAAAHAVTLLARVNDAARANLLALADGADLDQLAAFYDVVRISGETDTQLRRRTVLEIAGRSPGGTVERYRAKALGASSQVRQAHVWNDGETPIVRVSIISTAANGVAAPSLLNIVEDALNDDAVRMVNDMIEVVSAVTGVQKIEANIWLLPGTPRSTLRDLEDSIVTAWNDEGGIGRDLTRSWITARLLPAGVQKVEIVTPAADILVASHEAVSLGEVKLNFMGRDR